MNKLGIYDEWMQDPEFAGLPYQEKEGILGHYFDTNLTDDEFNTLPDTERAEIRNHFLGAHLGFDEPGRETTYHWAGARKQAGLDIARFPSDVIEGIGKLWEKGESREFPKKRSYNQSLQERFARKEAADQGEVFNQDQFREQERNTRTAKAQALISFGKTGTDFYNQIAEDSPDIQEFKEAAGKGDESIFTQALGAAGSLGGAVGMSMVPGVGPVLAGSGFFNLNKEEIKEMSLQKLLEAGEDPAVAEKKAEDISWTGGMINSLLDTVGAGRIAHVFKPARKFMNFLMGSLITSQIEGATEGTQGIVSQVSAEWASKPEDETQKQFVSRMVDNLPEYAKNAKTDYLIGSLLGGGAHVVGAGPATIFDNKEPVTSDPDINKALEAGAKRAAGNASRDDQAMKVYKDLLDSGEATSEQLVALQKRLPPEHPVAKDISDVLAQMEADTKSPDLDTGETPIELTDVVQQPIDIPGVPEPTGKSAESSAQVIDKVLSTEERVKQSAAYVEDLKKQIKEKSEKADVLGMEGRLPYVREYLRQLKEGEPGGRVRTEAYDGTQEWTGYGSTYPDWFKDQGWGRDKAVATLEKGLSGQPFAPSEMGKGEESIWEAALVAAEEQRNQGYIEYAAEIEENPELISGMPLDEYQLILGVLEDEKFYTGPITEASINFRQETEDETVKSVSEELGIPEEEFRGILEDEGQPEISLDRAWEDLSIEDKDFIEQWDREQRGEGSRGGTPREPVKSTTIDEGVKSAPGKDGKVEAEQRKEAKPDDQAHDYSSTQINLPENEAESIRTFSKVIPESEIYEDPGDPSYGREDQPHITVKYGLDTIDPKEVEPLLADQGPITAKMGEISIFESDDYDVVKVDIESPELHALNKKITDNLKVTDTYPTYPTYTPHATIAYVKKGEGKKYIGDKSFEGQEVKFDSLLFSGKDGKETVIPLKGAVGESPALTPKESLTVPKKAQEPELNPFEELKAILKNREALTLEGKEYALKEGFARVIKKKGHKHEGKMALTSAGIKKVSELKKGNKPLTIPGKDVKLKVKEELKKASEMSADDLLAEWDRQAQEVESQSEFAPKPTPKQKAKEASEHIASAVDKFKQINEILGEKGALSADKVDQAKWELIRPLLKEAWNDIVSAGKAGAEFVKLAMENLSPKGRPYFEKFVKEELGGGKHEDDAGRVEGDEAGGITDRSSLAAERVEDESSLEAGQLPGQDRGPVQAPETGTQEGNIEGRAEGKPFNVDTEGRGEPRTGSDTRSGQRSGSSEGRADVPGRSTPDADAGGTPVRDHRLEQRSENDVNHVIEDDDIIAVPGDESKIKANIRAIRLLKKLQSEDRNPTKEEKKILAKYVGWGSFSEKVFKLAYSRDLKKYGDEAEEHYWGSELDKFKKWKSKYAKQLHPALGGLLTEAEWTRAADSTMNAHYTSKEAIGAMWDLARHLGFQGGNITEPAGGVGHFFGLMPKDIAEKSTLQGVELDTITGGIFGKLYPEARIQITGFEKAKGIPDNSQDLIISNFPFGRYEVYDKKHPEYSKWSIHNYFFARSIDAVKPGGLVIGVTSHYTLDAKAGGPMRKALAAKADFLGAIRLPNNAFKRNAGTDVVTDIIVFRKKDGVSSGLDKDFRLVDNVEVKGEKEPAVINEYFVKNPDMVLGKHSLKGTMRGPQTEYTVDPTHKDLEAAISEAIKALPSDVAGEGATREETGKVKYADINAKEGALVLEDGKFYVIENGILTVPKKLNSKKKMADIVNSDSRERRARMYLDLREQTKQLIDRMQEEGATDEELKRRQARLGSRMINL